MADPRPILDLIQKHEAGPGAVQAQGVASAYDVVWGRIPREHRPQALMGAPLTRLTLAQVLAWQRDVVARGAASSAAGAYQFIRKTLEGTRALEGVPLDARFDAAMQDRLAVRLLIGRGWRDLVAGKISTVAFAEALAREWASFPVHRDQQGQQRPVKRGQSYYAGDGLNAASAKPEAVIAAIEAALRAGAVAPTEVIDHGQEARLAALEARVAAIEAKLAKVDAALG